MSKIIYESDCCGAPVEGANICSECGSHCEPLEVSQTDLFDKFCQIFKPDYSQVSILP